MTPPLLRQLLALPLACLILSCTAAGLSPPDKTRVAQAVKKEGDALQGQGDYTAALTKFLEAEKDLPHDPFLQNSLGLAYLGKKRYDLAVTAFQKSLKLKPDYTEAANNLGAAYLMQEKWDIAIDQFKGILKDLTYPTPHYPLSNIGWAYLEKGAYPNAQTYFNRALSEMPWFPTATHGLAQVYLRTGQHQRAMDHLHRCLKKTPDAVILHADLAEGYEKTGQTRRAVQAWKMVLKLAPGKSSLARDAQDRLDALLY